MVSSVDIVDGRSDVEGAFCLVGQLGLCTADYYFSHIFYVEYLDIVVIGVGFSYCRRQSRIYG